MDAVQQFQQFFEHCVGHWTTERTYHYVPQQEVERSHTEFVIQPLTLDRKAKVLSDNQYADLPDVEQFPGFHLAFDTVSEKGERVSQALNLMFVYEPSGSSTLTGDYLRDRAYEEAKPIVSKFQFQAENRELLMTTYYSRVVSVDSITLVNPSLRIRKIVNYRRPEDGEPLDEVLLVGFGVEQKTTQS